MKIWKFFGKFAKFFPESEHFLETGESETGGNASLPQGDGRL